ncbi:MAG: MBL fold metallo-hydrolase RNA specificity domain-containing protein [Akkermansiaceae bacterium]|tara:strand:- start:2971 stop:3273 length:303 start_codon:yes stop_codon:yes gene_type:complete
MKLKFCGVAGTTTSSQHLLEVNGQRIPLDCGMYQGRRKDSFPGRADHSELMDYFESIKGPKERVWLVHGEKTHSEALCDALREVHGEQVEVAELGTEVGF